jgi:low affinity Fe/Cu permease
MNRPEQHTCGVANLVLDGVIGIKSRVGPCRNRTASSAFPDMPRVIRQILTGLGSMGASPWAFATVALYALLWRIFDPRSLNWHAVATLAVWCMTLFIQRAEHRDTQAIHAKLDELLRADGKARSELTTLDKKEPEEIEAHRDGQQAKAKRSAKVPARSSGLRIHEIRC